MVKKLESITVQGELIGRIWQGIECYKEVNCTFTPNDRPFSHKWTGLRDALLHVTNDGDFQNCKLSNGVLIIRWYDGRRTIQMVSDIPYCKVSDDCIVN